MLKTHKTSCECTEFVAVVVYVYSIILGTSRESIGTITKLSINLNPLSGDGCSNLKTSLINVSLKFKKIDITNALLFLLEKM